MYLLTHHASPKKNWASQKELGCKILSVKWFTQKSRCAHTFVSLHSVLLCMKPHKTCLLTVRSLHLVATGYTWKVTPGRAPRVHGSVPTRTTDRGTVPPEQFRGEDAEASCWNRYVSSYLVVTYFQSEPSIYPATWLKEQKLKHIYPALTTDRNE